MTDAALTTDTLAVTYTGNRRVEAVKGVSLEFPRNQLTAIIGPSGCGKSTLLKSLNRLHEIQPNVEISGDVTLNGRSVYDTDDPIPEIRKRIGYVPQEPTPLPLSIYENVAYGLRIHGEFESDADLDDRVERYLRKVNLWEEVEDRLDAPGAELSRGQIQRLCLARSLAVEPEVLLCDEVTSALDPVSAETVEETLADLKSEYTIVMVTHSMDQARRLADEIVFLYLGEVVETNDATSFFENPQAERTKEFVAGHGVAVPDDSDDEQSEKPSVTPEQ
ncbi:phosphate ABC transporter ATP-binding protein [Natrarchaeobaculum sulfurireducens]|uniref:ABC-type phosphate transport system, ATPase component n=1 Tax=Natrarchaeobaculum sulfurireducens TaxID=2044521 RepID=A0A346PPW2_9EURY|nr:phosphate ABC transporter ATP-binding protein [Natrarchaeobaculum sulfurireducens]AXR78416.1 ABC-type phosphate transport system, ATPase component [Natrarchaeobaculum sulfurireducens]AXR81557.1 Phosphate transport ATP-binding protein PstB [Natrarchaeobaculum sulfurireducens]